MNAPDTGSDQPEIRLFNTLSKTKETFAPLDPANVRVYVCGPTVYDYAHIGNARPAIVFDILFRLLRHTYGNEHVTYVRNITDVDDKINARAARDFPGIPLNKAIQRLTGTTERQYQSDMGELGCLKPSLEPRATDHIAEMVEMISSLIKTKHAYIRDGHVLFSVNSFATDGDLQYGKLARRTLDDMIAGARVEVAPYKRDSMDFVLWKPSSEDEPGWDSPWGLGRPGWHIECSAMSKKYLGEVFDIHGGGIDLSFPHHENELAQSCCASGQPLMAQIWMHNGFLQINGEKMSKSEGNFYTVDELLHSEKFGGRKWPGDVLRLAMLMSHYRKPIDFSIERLEEADIVLAKLKTVTQRLFRNPAVGPSEAFLDALRNDLDTPSAIGSLARLARSAMGAERGVAHRATQGTEMIGGQQNREVYQLLAGLELLGIDINEYDLYWLRKQRSGRETEDTDIVRNIELRLQALAAKDFEKADAIRADLLEQGIQLMDYKDPETGERYTKWEVRR